jgi:hypothetical protein
VGCVKIIFTGQMKIAYATLALLIVFIAMIHLHVKSAIMDIFLMKTMNALIV